MSYPWNQVNPNASQSQVNDDSQISELYNHDKNATTTQEYSNNWQENANATSSNKNIVEEQNYNKESSNSSSRGKRDSQKNFSGSNYNSPKSYDRRHRSGSLHREGRDRRYGRSRDKYDKSYSRRDKRESGSRYKERRRRRSKSRSRSRSESSRSRSRSRSRSYKTKRDRRSKSRSNERRRRYSRSSSNSSENSNSRSKKSYGWSEKSVNLFPEHIDSGAASSSGVQVDEIPCVQAPPPVTVNPFKNDGSFLEMFKKMQNETLNKTESKPTPIAPPPPPAVPVVGKRRGGRVLKTGVVEKLKPVEEVSTQEQLKDPWSIYMKEVKKYRDASCQDESKTRLLVK